MGGVVRWLMEEEREKIKLWYTEWAAAYCLFHMQPPALLHFPAEEKFTSSEPSGCLCTSSDSPQDDAASLCFFISASGSNKMIRADQVWIYQTCQSRKSLLTEQNLSESLSFDSTFRSWSQTFDLLLSLVRFLLYVNRFFSFEIILLCLWEHECFLVFLHHVTQIFFICCQIEIKTMKAHSSFIWAVNQQQQSHLWAAGADGSFEDLLETTWPRLISQLVLVGPQLHQSSTSPQVHQRIHHCTKCFSSQLLLCAVCVQVSVSNKLHL